MSWRWFKSFKLGGGVRANVSQRGVGYSFGFGMFRVCTSPTGRRWISVRVPVIGIRFFKYIGSQPHRRQGEDRSRTTSCEQSLHEQHKGISWKNIK
jgi:hypothetical protein